MASRKDSKAKTVLVTGANGYIGNAVARAFARAGWLPFGLVRSESSRHSLELEEIIPVVAPVDDPSTWEDALAGLPALDVIISTTEDLENYTSHYNNIISLLGALAPRTFDEVGYKPLFIFTSGCKDYGMGPHIHGTPDLKPHTEKDPINPPNFAKDRATYALGTLNFTNICDPVLVRPTNVYGRSSSYFRAFFEVANQASNAASPLILTAPPNNILHAMHVDDCAEAYLAIASHPRREEIAGEIFNISAERYETLDDVARALVSVYGLGGMKYVEKRELPVGQDPWPAMLIDFPPWTASEKLRRTTGWSDRRMQFGQGIRVYKMAYDAAARAGDEGIKKIQDRIPILEATLEG